MTLKTYKQKRNFRQTKEPSGAIKHSPGQLTFVVQKHQASHLHYDFRLEAEGVLKSWAVPKGPSTDPSIKRLAMMVEDHPFDYRNFEGTIPEGNYGAGTVMVWDRGTYFADEKFDRKENEAAVLAGLNKGHLNFTLEGTKLKGRFSIIKIRSRDGKDNTWLLLRKGNDFPDVKASEYTESHSAVSGRTMEEIAKGKKQWISNRKSGDPVSTKKESVDLSRLPQTRLPRSVKPMLATLVEKAFDRKGWIYELKWDGFRAIAEVMGKKVRLYSRNDNALHQFKPVCQDLKALKKDVVLDGEVVVVDQNGKSDFQLLQNYMKTGEGRLQYYVFDILYYDGRDLTGLPLKERKAILKSRLPDLSSVRYSDHIEEQGTSLLKEAAKMGVEGILAKDGDSPYLVGTRSHHWLKIKILRNQEAVIGGFTDPKGGRKHLGALILGVYQNDALIYIGHAGGGFNSQGLDAIKKKLLPLIVKKCPFKIRPKTNAPATWVEPKLVCEVKFIEWTQDGHMRQPIFLGLRQDKDALDVKRENPETVNQALQAEQRETNTAVKKNKKVKSVDEKSDDEQLKFGKIEVKLTHLNKIYWPKEKYTKGDLIDYYRQMAPVILPYLKNRPLSLNRHPNGIDGGNFFQKDVGGKVEKWIKTVPVFSDSHDETIDYMVCNDEATLLYMVNLGCIEINPWNSSSPHLDKPDYLVLDFDPEDISFSKVVEAVSVTKEVLDSIKVPAYCKTSGATGIHVYVPLGAKYTYDQAKEFAELINLYVHNQLPNTTSVERMPQKRQKRIYLDFLQNRQGQTMAAPYSLRPKPGAPVSTPILWSEVNPKLDPRDFNIKTIFPRLKKAGDLWKSSFKSSIDMKSALDRLGNLFEKRNSRPAKKK